MADGGTAPSVPATVPDPEMDIDVQAISDSILQHKLSNWVGLDKAKRSSDCFYYGLNHRYVEEGFSLNALQQNDKDRDLSRPLVDIVNTIPIEVFLALMDRDEDAEENGTAQNGCESYLVRKLVDLDGHPYVSGFPLQDTFKGVVRPVLEPPQSSNHLEAALIFIPRDTVAEFFLGLHKITNKTVLTADKSFPDLKNIMVRYANLCLPQGPRRTRLMPILKELVTRILELEEKLEFECLTEAEFSLIGRALSRARDWALLERIVIQSKGVHGLGLAKWVGVLIKGGHAAMEDVDKWMTACASSSPYIHKRCEALEEFLSGSDGEGGTRSWAVKVFTEKIIQDPPKGSFSFEDGSALVAMLFRLFDFKDAAAHLNAFVQKHASQVTLMIGTVVQLDQYIATSPTVPLLGASTLFNDLAKQTVDVLDLSRLCTSLTVPLRKLLEVTVNNKMPNKRSVDYNLHSISSTSQSPMLPIKPDQLGQFMSALFRQKIKDSMLMQLAFKTVAKAPLIRNPELFASLWLPFLRELVDILETNKIPLSTPRYGHMFAALLEAYIASNKTRRPEVREWIAQVNNICACNACLGIRKFITGPTVHYESHNVTFDQVNHIKRHCLEPLDVRTLCGHDIHTGRVHIQKVGAYTSDTLTKWEIGVKTTRKEMDRFELSKLKEILGADFTKIWNLKDLALPQPPVRFPPPPPVPRQHLQQQVPEPVPQWYHPVPLPPRPPPAAITPVTTNTYRQAAGWNASAPPHHMNTGGYYKATPIQIGPNTWVVNNYMPSMTPLPMGSQNNAPHLPSIRNMTMGLPPAPPLPPAIRPLGQPLNNRMPMATPVPPPSTAPQPVVRHFGPPPSNNVTNLPPPPPLPVVRHFGPPPSNNMTRPPAPPRTTPGSVGITDCFPRQPAARLHAPSAAQPIVPIPTTRSLIPPARSIVSVTRPVTPVSAPPSTAPTTPANKYTALHDSPRAYSMFASEIEGSLRRKFPEASKESMTKALRKRWDALEEKDKAMYNELARKKSSNAAGGASSGTGVTGLSCPKAKYGSKPKILTPVQKSSNSDLELVSIRSLASGSRSYPNSQPSSSRASGRAVQVPPRTPLQATSGNSQRAWGNVPSAVAGGKRKYAGGHVSSRPAPSLREATLAGQLYHPPVGPMGSAAKAKGRADVIDLTLDSD